MAEYLDKLRPDRDLQCYFERPSAIAALSEASETRFTVSGCWRSQFDWAVVEWNRDNVFEHPAFRYLPDGDLSGLRLSYEETRSTCIALDSTWYSTVDWPYLRIWTEDALYKISLKEHATPVDGSYGGASAGFDLDGTAVAGDYVELAWGSEHHSYQMVTGDMLENAAQAIAASIQAYSPVMKATADGRRITLTYSTESGANGNRIGVYCNIAGRLADWKILSGGTSPTKWRVNLDFACLQDEGGAIVPASAIRKMRWTWAADIQPGAFTRSEFAVAVTDWTVTGLKRRYRVAGAGSRRLEDDSPDMHYEGQWTEGRGNFSGGSLRYTTVPGSRVTCSYRAEKAHSLYLGTRRAPGCGSATVAVDGRTPQTFQLGLDGEDVLVRILVADLPGCIDHTVTVTHSGTTGSYLYFDFLEAAVAGEELPLASPDAQTTLATDWDTDHSIALAPERTAWMIRSLGFQGRANHYVGALWFYELVRPGHRYASGTIEFTGAPEFGRTTQILVGPTVLSHLNLIGDSADSIAKAFELEINAGSTGVWAQADGGRLTISSRAMGTTGNAITIDASTNSGAFQAQKSGSELDGGADGDWRTDLSAIPRLNRAVRDWSRSFYRAMAEHGSAVAAAFSMELQHGDPSPEADIAQRYPDGLPCVLNTPALQTNFSRTSGDFWKQSYSDMAAIMAEAGQEPFLQFGEVQWWYFPTDGSGMPFYDAYTTSRFEATYGRPMHIFANGDALAASYPVECAFLSQLIGEFTDAIMAFVRETQPQARFEVLYPPDVNEAPLNAAVNLPAAWSPSKLDSFKTENFTYTGSRDLDKARDSIALPIKLGFTRDKGAHLVGIGDYASPWEKETQLAKGEGFGSVVLFALDQYCLMGLDFSPREGGRSTFLGA